MRFLCTIPVFALILGCASQSALTLSNSVPADFTLEVRDSTGDGALFIVEPDRWFHAATGAVPDGYHYPPATRQLSPEQMKLVWRAIESSGVLASDPAPGDRDSSRSPVWVQVQAERRIATAWLNPESEQTRALLRPLRELAWLNH